MIHPFHPLYQRKFRLVTYRFNWGEDRVYFHGEDGRLASLPAAWSSAVPPDPFVVVANGPSAFRVQDLTELASLLKQLDEDSGGSTHLGAPCFFPSGSRTGITSLLQVPEIRHFLGFFLLELNVVVHLKQDFAQLQAVRRSKRGGDFHCL